MDTNHEPTINLYRRARDLKGIKKILIASGVRYDIAVEDPRGRYANIIATRAEDKDKPWARKLVQAYQSEEVRKFIETEFKGSLVPAF